MHDIDISLNSSALALTKCISSIRSGSLNNFSEPAVSLFVNKPSCSHISLQNAILIACVFLLFSLSLIVGLVYKLQFQLACLSELLFIKSYSLSVENVNLDSAHQYRICQESLG